MLKEQNLHSKGDRKINFRDVFSKGRRNQTIMTIESKREGMRRLLWGEEYTFCFYGN